MSSMKKKYKITNTKTNSETFIFAESVNGNQVYLSNGDCGYLAAWEKIEEIEPQKVKTD